jgi:uncharacterized protein YukE|tara:strand:+ start:2026 stop:2316 length:291 start_codon:yes stop_codon:yes gene_type:complete
MANGNGKNGDDRRTDPTWNAIRKNWPILLIAVSIVAGGVRSEMTISAQQKDIVILQQLLNREAFTKFAVWQNNTDRDIKDLKRWLERVEVKMEKRK